MKEKNQIIYENIISNKKALSQLKAFEIKLQQHERRVVQLKRTTANTETKLQNKVVRNQQQTTTKTERIKQQEANKAKRLRAAEATRVKKFEAWKLTQIRSAAFERLSIEQKMNVKRLLSSGRTEEEIRAEYKKTTSVFLREQKRRKQMERNRKKVSTGSTAKGAGAGAAGGGLIAGAMMNPYVAGAALVAGGGAMLVKGGADDYKSLQQGAQLTGMDYNTFARESAGMAAVSGMSQESVADKMKDINERAGQVIRGETRFDAESGRFKGGEAEGLANLFMKKGIINKSGSNAAEVFSQSPDKLIKLAAQATEGMSVQQRTSILEDFASDFSNIVQGYQQNRSGYETAKANAVQFTEQDAAAAKEFSLALSGIASSLGQIPINVFKEFTNSLSPEALEMLGKLGKALGKLGGIFGDILAITLNLLSNALNPLLDIINWLLEKIKPLTEALAGFSKEIASMFSMLTGMVKSFIDKIMSMLPSWMKSDAPGATTNHSTPATPVTNHALYSKPTLPVYGKYGSSPAIAGSPQQINVALNIDGETLATNVVNTESFNSGVNRNFNSAMVGGR